VAQIVRVGVLGCGIMGHGITQVAAEAGYDLIVREVSEEKLSGGIARIEKQLARAVEREKMSREDATR
jgi:3-hydroxybutyryl-CoA dehydrogenase